jgi:hypothetical protein
VAVMRALVLREQLLEAIARRERALSLLSCERRALGSARHGRPELDAWLAFLLLIVIVAGAGVWLGVAARALHPPTDDCVLY